MRVMLGHNSLMLCLYFFQLGYLANAVIRRVSMPVWPPDTHFPIILGILTVVLIAIQFVNRLAIQKRI